MNEIFHSYSQFVSVNNLISIYVNIVLAGQGLRVAELAGAGGTRL